jgi:hypothetical protein
MPSSQCHSTLIAMLSDIVDALGLGVYRSCFWDKMPTISTW